jgi:hypothetical protein
MCPLAPHPLPPGSLCAGGEAGLEGLRRDVRAFVQLAWIDGAVVGPGPDMTALRGEAWSRAWRRSWGLRLLAAEEDEIGGGSGGGGCVEAALRARLEAAGAAAQTEEEREEVGYLRARMEAQIQQCEPHPTPAHRPPVGRLPLSAAPARPLRPPPRAAFARQLRFLAHTWRLRSGSAGTVGKGAPPSR